MSTELYLVDKFSMTEVYKEVTTFVGQFEQRFASQSPEISSPEISLYDMTPYDPLDDLEGHEMTSSSV